MYPIVPQNARQASADTTLPSGGGPDQQLPVFIPKGMLVGWNLYSMHRRTDIYGEDAEEFKPERWLDEDGKKGIRPGWAFLPFNGGPRICIGQQFALYETSYILIRLLQEFSAIESRESGPWRENLTVRKLLVYPLLLNILTPFRSPAQCFPGVRSRSRLACSFEQDDSKIGRGILDGMMQTLSLSSNTVIGRRHRLEFFLVKIPLNLYNTLDLPLLSYPPMYKSPAVAPSSHPVTPSSTTPKQTYSQYTISPAIA